MTWRRRRRVVVGGCGDGHDPVEFTRAEVARLPRETNAVDAWGRVVVVREEMSWHERVGHPLLVDLGQMDVLELGQDVPEDRLVGGHGFARTDARPNVPVLEVSPVFGCNRHMIGSDARDSARFHRIDGRVVRSRDVDAVVELEDSCGV